MDPIPDLPPITSYPSDQSPAMITHPPYAEMIIAAITALKDKDGSSRQAISKYIEKEFTNLPPTHSTLLTHHLKRLKNLGQLVMLKHSYMLPPPRIPQFQPTDYHPTLDFSSGGDFIHANDNVEFSDGGGINLEDPSSGFSKRKPGRPPKLKNIVSGLGLEYDQTSNVPLTQVNSGYPDQYQVGAGYGLGLGFHGDSRRGSEPLFASLGLGDEGVVVEPSAVPDNTPLVVKRGRGRPPKSASGNMVGSGGNHVTGDGEVQANVAGSDGGGEFQGTKAVATMGGNVGRVKRGRGRPRRFGKGPVTVPLSGNLLRPRGRAKRVARPHVVVNGGAGVVLRRRGQPLRNMVASFTGKSLGRPRKGGLGTVVLVTDPEQLVVYQELKNKYVNLQSKVKQVASMVKSCIDPDYGNTALGALQELEDLAGEVNAPSHGQTKDPSLSLQH